MADCTHQDHWDAVYSAMPCPGCRPVPKVADAGGPAPPLRPRRHLWLYYVWGERRSIAEPIGDNEPAARRMLQGLIDLYQLPDDGKWYRGPREAQP